VAFINLLEGIEEQSRLWDCPVRKIYHDRQMQFEKNLKFWHELLSNASPDPLILPGGERHVFRRVFGSEFVMSTADDSPGIQATDVVLWLFKRVAEGDDVGPNSARLMLEVFRRATLHDFCFESVSHGLKEFFEKLERMPITEKQMKKGREFLALVESRRRADA